MAPSGNTPLKECLVTAHISQEEGKGCVFAHQYKMSNDPFIDRPLYSYIHRFSRMICLTCENCFRPVGTIRDNLHHLLKVSHTTLPNGLHQLLSSYQDNRSWKNFTRCEKCRKVFCSTTCLTAYKAVHTLLCEAMTKDEHEYWAAFQRFCMKQNENFCFVGLIYATMIAEAMYNNCHLGDMIATLDNYYGAPWHTIPPKGDKGAHDEVDRLASASDAFELLMLALNRFMRSLKAQYACHVDRLSTLNYYLELLGKVELVAVEIEIENPVNEQLHALMEDATVRSIIGKQLTTTKCILYGLEYVDTDIDDCDIELPDIMGVGIYTSLSRLNHSCHPNLEVEYGDTNMALVRLLRPVSEGEQATIAYIDESIPLQERRMALWNNYRFVCRCQKCLSEEAAAEDETSTSTEPFT